MKTFAKSFLGTELSWLFIEKVNIWFESNLFFCEDDSAQQLILQSPHGDSEVDDGGTSADFRGVGWIRQLGSHIQPEALHHIHLFVTHFHLNKEEEKDHFIGHKF